MWEVVPWVQCSAPPRLALFHPAPLVGRLDEPLVVTLDLMCIPGHALHEKG